MREKYIIDNLVLMKEWDWDKNNELGFYPDKLTCGVSRLSVFWRCIKCGYGWSATPNNRSRGTGCPLCANRVIVKGKNDLETLYPEIAKRWHPILNTLTPNKVAAHSNKKVYWICEKDSRHYFLTRVDHMVDGGVDCPVCANQTIIVGVNDLSTTNAELIKEWDFERNIDIVPEKCTYGTQKRVWWKCEKEHRWQATISSRAIQKCGCPICKKELRTSFAEDAIAYYLSKYFKVERSKHFDWLGAKEIDIYLPDLFLGVEYDGERWHKDIVRDFEKDTLCNNNGLTLIRIREPKCQKYDTTAKLIVLSKKDDFGSLNKVVLNIVDYIINHFSCACKLDVNVERDYDEILKMHTIKEKEKCIVDETLLKEWHYEKNAPLLPSMFKSGCKKKVWWKCSLGHEWKSVIYSRTGKEKCGCPYCAGKKVIEKWNDLQTLYPHIAQEWDYQQNAGILPSQVRPQTNKKYGWICSSCNNKWLASVAHRVRGEGCPKCGRVKTRYAKMRKVLNIDTSTQYESAVEAGRVLDINAGAIRNCCNGKTRSAGGYHWRYMED